MSAECSTNNRKAPWYIPRGYIFLHECLQTFYTSYPMLRNNKYMNWLSLTKLGYTKCEWVKSWCHIITETSLKVYLILPYSPLPSPKTKALLRITCWVQTFLLKKVSSEEGCMSLGANLTETCKFFSKCSKFLSLKKVWKKKNEK